MRHTRDQQRPFFKWKSKFGGMDVSDARKLKALEEESARLKKLLANLIIRERRLLRRQLERLRGGYDANGPERPIEDEQRQKIAELTSTANSEIPV